MKPELLNQKAILAAIRAHDKEDAAQKGEPDPWADDFPEPYLSERMAAMELAVRSYQAEAALQVQKPGWQQAVRDVFEIELKINQTPPMEALEMAIAAATPPGAEQMTTLSELIAKLEALDGPDREVDAHLFVMAEGGRIHWIDGIDGDLVWEKPIDGFWVRSPSKLSKMPRYTASIDCAVALVERKLPGWRIEMRIGDWPAHDQRRVTLWNNDITKRENVFGISADAATPAIALLLALLRALEQSNDEVGRT